MRRPTRRELSYFAHGLNRCNEPMTAALLEVVSYRAGVRRAVGTAAASAIARKYGVSERGLQRRTRLAMLYLPQAIRNASREDLAE